VYPFQQCTIYDALRRDIRVARRGGTTRTDGVRSAVALDRFGIAWTDLARSCRGRPGIVHQRADSVTRSICLWDASNWMNLAEIPLTMAGRNSHVHPDAAPIRIETAKGVKECLEAS